MEHVEKEHLGSVEFTWWSHSAVDREVTDKLRGIHHR